MSGSAGFDDAKLPTMMSPGGTRIKKYTPPKYEEKLPVTLNSIAAAVVRIPGCARSRACAVEQSLLTPPVVCCCCCYRHIRDRVIHTDLMYGFGAQTNSPPRHLLLGRLILFGGVSRTKA
jgi:hypothetical protein